MAVRDITDAEFDEAVIQSPMPVLLVLGAEWAGPCRMFAPTLDVIEGKIGNQVRVLALDIDTNAETPQKVDLKGVPGLMAFKDGQRLGSMVGDLPAEEVYAWLERLGCLD
jgi:thioredoxin 1